MVRVSDRLVASIARIQPSVSSSPSSVLPSSCKSLLLMYFSFKARRNVAHPLLSRSGGALTVVSHSSPATQQATTTTTTARTLTTVGEMPRVAVYGKKKSFIANITDIQALIDICIFWRVKHSVWQHRQTFKWPPDGAGI